MSGGGVDISLSFFASVAMRWARSCGYAPQSARISLHHRSATAACGPLGSGCAIHVMGDDLADAAEHLTRRMLSEIGERGDYAPALVASIEEARARREREAREVVPDER